MEHQRGPWPVLYRWALTTFSRLPRPVRLFLIRRGTPSHVVGALCFIEYEDRLLMLRQAHRRGWTLPGGLINRGESAHRAVEREVLEETGLQVEVGLPIGTVVEPGPRRVDVIYRVQVDRPVEIFARSEALAAEWLRLDEVGELDPPTRTAFDVLLRSRQADAYTGRLRPGAEPGAGGQPKP